MEQGDGPSPAVRLWVPTSRKPASPRGRQPLLLSDPVSTGVVGGGGGRGPTQGPASRLTGARTGSGQLVGGLLATLLTPFHLFLPSSHS